MGDVVRIEKGCLRYSGVVDNWVTDNRIEVRDLDAPWYTISHYTTVWWIGWERVDVRELDPVYAAKVATIERERHARLEQQLEYNRAPDRWFSFPDAAAWFASRQPGPALAPPKRTGGPSVTHTRGQMKRTVPPPAPVGSRVLRFDPWPTQLKPLLPTPPTTMSSPSSSSIRVDRSATHAVHGTIRISLVVEARGMPYFDSCFQSWQRSHPEWVLGRTMDTHRSSEGGPDHGDGKSYYRVDGRKDRQYTTMPDGTPFLVFDSAVSPVVVPQESSKKRPASPVTESDEPQTKKAKTDTIELILLTVVRTFDGETDAEPYLFRAKDIPFTVAELQEEIDSESDERILFRDGKKMTAEEMAAFREGSECEDDHDFYGGLINTDAFPIYKGNRFDLQPHEHIKAFLTHRIHEC